MHPKEFVEKLTEFKFSPYMGVPCSVFKSLLNYISEDDNVESYICSSEGEAMGLSAGFALSGKTPVVYLQNDGYGNIVNPLSSLQLMYKLPTLLLISWRAEPGIKDAPQHIIMGKTILNLLDIFSIPYIILNEDNLLESLIKAKEYIKNNSKPFAFIIKKGYFDSYNLSTKTGKQNLYLRIDYLKILNKYVLSTDLLLGSTGYCGRELYQTINHKQKFYMMGSMGCLSSIGLGIAIENPNKRIFVLDGDGALLMKMGSLSTIGHYLPKNLIHICFDNNSYESTGGQPTTANTTDFAKVALACGYKTAVKIYRLNGFEAILSNLKMNENPKLIHIKIKSGSIEGLQRPKETPEEMRDNLRKFL